MVSSKDRPEDDLFLFGVNEETSLSLFGIRGVARWGGRDMFVKRGATVLQVEYKDLSEIKPYEANPRKNKKAISAVAASIQTFGFKVPIVLDQNNEIVCGHTRWAAAQKLGLVEVPCIYANDLTEDEIKAYRLADNKTGEFAKWDDEKLDVELDEIQADMVVFGFEARPNVCVREDACDGRPPKTARACRGDIWVLGRHRVMCGDAADPSDIALLMDGAFADMLLTDPPERLSFDATGGDEDALGELVASAFRLSDSVMKPGSVFYIWHTERNSFLYRGVCRELGWTVRQCLVWNYSEPRGIGDYLPQHESCLYGWKDGAPHLWASNRRQTTVLSMDRPPMARDCPWMKPILLFDFLMQNNTKGADIVLDLFAGSGTTVIAAEQNGRTAYCMEIEPCFVDMIVARYIKLTGDKNSVSVIRNGSRLSYKDAKGGNACE